MRTKFAAVVILIAATSASHAQEAYERTLTWSANDGGVSNCPDQYFTHAVSECLPGGIDAIPKLLQGRACAMTRAIGLAKMDQCRLAFELSLITQCHNPSEQDVLRQAGVVKVCDYLKRF